jgi:hypothetical protein
MAEILGPSGTSRVLDLCEIAANNISVFTPAYVIYNGETQDATKVALFNYLSDGDEATISVDLALQGVTANIVWVKYLLASSVSQIGRFTWAGQVRV